MHRCPVYNFIKRKVIKSNNIFKYRVFLTEKKGTIDRKGGVLSLVQIDTHLSKIARQLKASKKKV